MSERPLDYDCRRQGCFQEVMQPRLKFFSQYLGGNCSPSDIDGVIERNGHVLLIEWKTGHADIPTGQHITFETFAFKRGIPVLVIWGEPREMTTHKQRRYTTGGAIIDSTDDMEETGRRLNDWFQYAERYPWEGK